MLSRSLVSWLVLFGVAGCHDPEGPSRERATSTVNPDLGEGTGRGPDGTVQLTPAKLVLAQNESGSMSVYASTPECDSLSLLVLGDEHLFTTTLERTKVESPGATTLHVTALNTAAWAGVSVSSRCPGSPANSGFGVVCVKATCPPNSCGQVSDGCGGTMFCGLCPGTGDDEIAHGRPKTSK
jgi:hypothetical protein